MPSYKSVNNNICQLHNLEACLLCSLRNIPSIQSSKHDLNLQSLELRKKIVAYPPPSSINNTCTNDHDHDDDYNSIKSSIRDTTSTSRVASDASYPYSDSHYSTGANHKFIPNQPKHNPQNYSDSFNNYR